MTAVPLPADAIEAAERALFEVDGYDPETWEKYRGEDWALDYPPAARAALTAAMPFIEQAVRVKVAEEIEAVEPFPGDDDVARGVNTGMARAAAFIRSPSSMPRGVSS